MKVCLLAPLPPFRGGIAKYCYSLAQELEKRHELLLLSYRRQYPALLYGRRSQLAAESATVSISAEFSRLSYDIDSASMLSWIATVRTITAFEPDLVILPWWVVYWTPMYLFLLYSLKKRRIKVIFLCINIFEHEDNALKKLLTKIVLGRIDAMLVHSEQEKELALAINPRATVRKHLLPLFTYHTCSGSTHDKDLHLLFFGFVRQYKGLDILLKAIGILKNHDISLKIAGEIWQDKDRYSSLINTSGITDKVEIIDRYLSDAEMSEFFAWADVVVLPYRISRTSGVIATAYGYGKPVLVTDVGGFREVVQEGLTGKIVPPGEPQALAEGIEWFLANREIDFPGNIAEFTARTMSWRSLVDTIEECTGH
jgi:glycosyltransferase involved in cell wall biosynthesis